MRLPLAAVALAVLAGCGAPRVQTGTIPARFERKLRCRPGARDSGPTVQLRYGTGQARGSPIAEFTYFVPLISPHPVDCSTSPDNTQWVRLLSIRRRWGGRSFAARCDFEIVGEGSLRHTFDHSLLIRRDAKILDAGDTLRRKLYYVHFEGGGRGAVEVSGRIADGLATVTEVTLYFDAGGCPSPVTVGLHDIRRENGQVTTCNPVVGRVDALTFRRGDEPPHMIATLDSLKPADAASTWWENTKGAVVAGLANLFVRPVRVDPLGNEAMLDFGRALICQDPAFTFPKARNLRQPVQ